MKIPLDPRYSINIKNGKIELFSKSFEGKHYTVQFGLSSGLLDIHETLEKPKQNESRYKTLAVYSHISLLRLISKLRVYAIKDLTNILQRRVSISKLHKNEFIIQLLNLEISNESVDTNTKGQKIKMPKNIDSCLLEKYFVEPMNLKNIKQVYSIVCYKVRRRKIQPIGVGIASPKLVEQGKVVLFFFNDKRNYKYMQLLNSFYSAQHNEQEMKSKQRRISKFIK